MERLFKIVLLTAVFGISILSETFAQISVGVGLNPGLGYLRSAGLKDAASIMKSQNGDQQYSYRTKAGVQIGFHAVVQYRLTHQLSLVAMPGIRFVHSSINGLLIKNDPLSGSNYLEQKITSTATLIGTQYQLPLLAKYYIIPDKQYFATAGLCFSYSSPMKLNSTEDSTNAYYINNMVDPSSVKRLENKNIKLDQYNPFQMGMLLGIGTSVLTGYRHNLDIELSYYIPFTSSNYYTTNASFSSQALLNQAFTQTGKQNIESATGKSLHYNMHMINLTVRYLIYSKVK
jgi:hypothetical protein